MRNGGYETEIDQQRCRDAEQGLIMLWPAVSSRPSAFNHLASGLCEVPVYLSEARVIRGIIQHVARL